MAASGRIDASLATLRTYNLAMTHQPRKRFGQNFLHDPGIIQRIVAAISPRPDDHIAEIGPGQGAITQHLVGACGMLDVVELDRDLVREVAFGARLADLGRRGVRHRRVSDDRRRRAAHGESAVEPHN